MEKGKQKIKKTYSEDYVGAILEEIQGDFKVFGEGLNDVKRGLNEVKSEVTGLNKKIDRIDDRLIKVSDTVDLLVEDMDEVKANIVDIKIELKDINGKLGNKAEKEVVEKHENRIFKLEKTILATR